MKQEIMEKIRKAKDSVWNDYQRAVKEQGVESALAYSMKNLYAALRDLLEEMETETPSESQPEVYTDVGLKGYVYADGVHWYWKEREVAIIDQSTSEIQWCVQKCTLPQKVIDAVRHQRPEPLAKWLIEVKRIDTSVTQGSFEIQVNGKYLISFEDKRKIGEDKKWHSEIADEDLGQLVCAAFWHPNDDVYHYSERAKKMFYPKHIEK